MRATGVASVLAATALLLAGCSSGDPKAAPADRRTSSGPSSSPGASTTTVRATKVLVVVEENHSYAQMRKGMPFLAGLSEKYGYATDWKAIAHPSEPNYLAMAGGSTFGVTDDKAPAAHYGDVGSARSVFDQALAAGKTAGTYAESMPKSCHVYDHPDRSVGTPVYAVRHNPWVYFRAGRKDCTRYDLALPAFTEDAADNVLPNVAFLIPNLEHDAHDGSLAAADRWLERQLGPVLGSDDFTSGKLVVVVTADEDDKHSGNTVLTSVLTPALTGKVVDTPLTHYSLTRFIADVLGVEPLGEGAHAPDLRAAFGL
jgi:phosphatidylinositol-3-phosphatase